MPSYVCASCDRATSKELDPGNEINGELYCEDCSIGIAAECSHCSEDFNTYRLREDVEADLCAMCLRKLEAQSTDIGPMGGYHDP